MTRALAVALLSAIVLVAASGANAASWEEIRKPRTPPAGAVSRGNLDCSGAIPIEVGQTIWATNVGGPTNVDQYPVCVDWLEDGGEVVFELTMPGPTDDDIGISLWYRIDLCDLDWFLLGSCDEADCIEYDDYGWPVDEIPPGTYYIVVDGYEGDECEFVLSVYWNEETESCSPLTSVCQMWDFNASDEGFVHRLCGVPVTTWEWGAAPLTIPETACGDVEVSNVLCTGLSGTYPSEAGDAAYVGPVTLETGCTCLELCHYYDTEEYYDGGMVGLSTDDGVTWELLTPARGYDSIGDWDSSCIGPFPCFNGQDHEEFLLDSFDLTPWVGETIWIGFFFGADGSSEEQGWYILSAAIGSSESPVEDATWGTIKALYR